MGYEKKDGDFTLFKNDKGDNPKRPDYRGEAIIDGADYEIAGWIKKGAKGAFIAGSIKPKSQDTRPKDGGLSGSRPRASAPDDDIPFAPCVD